MNSHIDPTPAPRIEMHATATHLLVPATDQILNFYTKNFTLMKQLNFMELRDANVDQILILQAQIVDDWRKATDRSESETLAVAVLGLNPL